MIDIIAGESVDTHGCGHTRSLRSWPPTWNPEELAKLLAAHDIGAWERAHVTSPIIKTEKITRQTTGTRPGTGTGPGIGKGHTQWRGSRPRMEGHHVSVRPGEQPVTRTALHGTAH